MSADEKILDIVTDTVMKVELIIDEAALEDEKLIHMTAHTLSIMTDVEAIERLITSMYKSGVASGLFSLMKILTEAQEAADELEDDDDGN